MRSSCGLWNQPLRIGIVESFYASYHGDLGSGLVSETDVNGAPTSSPRFVDIQSRLNVDIGWRRFRAFTRFDTAAYPDRPAGSCGPDATTPVDAAQPLLPKPVLRREMGHRVQRTHHRGGARRLLRLVRARHGAVDPQDRRARHRHHLARRQARLSRRIASPRRWSSASPTCRTSTRPPAERCGDYAPEATFLRPVAAPRDFIGGARAEYRFFDRVNVGLHEVGGMQALDATPQHAAPRLVLHVRRQRRRAEAVALARRLLRRRGAAADAVGRAPLGLRALRRAQRLLRHI